MPTHQYSLPFITHEVNNAVISQRASDGYINATALCKAGGKLFAHYMENAETKEFLEELALDIGIPIAKGNQALIQVIHGGSGPQGSWIHPQVSIHLGQWVSAKFAVKVSKWVFDWMSGKSTPAPLDRNAGIPAYFVRYMENDGRVPLGYFSILQETGVALYGPLHKLGFDIPSNWIPDISVGKMFCAWLRENKGVDTSTLETYQHDYLDGRVVPANIYPNDFLVDYRHWFGTVWLPQQGVKYFKKKDPQCLTFIDRMPTLAAPARKARITYSS